MSRRIPQDIQERVRSQAKNRCGYCKSAQKYVLGPLEIEHIIPKAKGGTDEEKNLIKMEHESSDTQLVAERQLLPYISIIPLP